MYEVEEGRGEGPRCSLSTWEIRELRVDVIWMPRTFCDCSLEAQFVIPQIHITMEEAEA